MASLEEIIRKYALKNALDYGKANASAVVGKVIAEWPDAKKDMKGTMRKIQEIIAEINGLPKSKIENEIKNYEFVEKKEETKGITLPNAAVGHVVTRFPPEPNGYPHIGHAKAVWLGFEAARSYTGRFLLRFDDTNPEKESKEFADAIADALQWLGITWDKETYTSDRLHEIYEYAQRLVSQGNAYVCGCPVETLRALRERQEACACRTLPSNEHLSRWKRMRETAHPGEAVLRFKGDLASLNSVMRDPTLARIVTAKHYHQGTRYRVWPSYDLAVVVMDHLEGVTHPMRSKEYELRDELYYALCDALGFARPTLVSFARLEIKRAPVSKRLLAPLVQEKKVAGWDDPRLPTIAGLRRRGILPEAIQRFVLRFGLGKSESEPGWELLLSENRKLLDPVAPHFFFVPAPKVLPVDLNGAFTFTLKGRPHAVPLAGAVYIPQDDFNHLKKNDVFALKDLAFVRWDGNALKKVDQKEIPSQKFQWVSVVDALPCEVLTPGDLLDAQGNYNPKSLEVISGYCERACLQLNEGDIVQFERFGFCRLDEKEKDKVTFIYSC